jgi:hypothetical protein
LSPTTYWLTIQTFLPSQALTKTNATKLFTFDANITIQFTCRQPTDRIYLHSLKLNISLAQFNLERLDNRENINLVDDVSEAYRFYERVEQIRFKLTTVLQPGYEYKLTLSYNGDIHQGALNGLYLTAYTENSKTKWAINGTTRFRIHFQISCCVTISTILCTQNDPLFRWATHEGRLLHYNCSSIQHGCIVESNGNSIQTYWVMLRSVQLILKLFEYLAMVGIAQYLNEHQRCPRIF